MKLIRLKLKSTFYNNNTNCKNLYLNYFLHNLLYVYNGGFNSKLMHSFRQSIFPFEKRVPSFVVVCGHCNWLQHFAMHRKDTFSSHANDKNFKISGVLGLY